MSVKVTFTYNEPSRTWVPTVEGVGQALEARQAFSAVVLTCQGLHPQLLNHTKVDLEYGGVKGEVPRSYKITPAVFDEQTYQEELERLAAMSKAAKDTGLVVDVMPEETPCQSCGTPTPLGVSYCSECEKKYT